MNYVKKIVDKKNAAVSLKRNASIAKSQGISEGYLSCSAQNVDTIKNLNCKVEELTKDFAGSEKKIRDLYHKQQSDYERAHKNKCKICHQGMEAERKRLVYLQEEFVSAIHEFQIYEKRLNTFVSKFEITFNNLLQGIGKLTASETELSLIGRDFKKFVKQKQSLIEISPPTGIPDN